MTAIQRTITQSADDAQQTAGTVTIDGSALNANSDTGWLGVRFQNLTIPRYSTINTATLKFYFTSGSFDDPKVYMWGELAANAAAFAASSNNISGRTPTSVSVTWNQSNLGSGVKTSPSIVSLLQEIVNQATWTSGNSAVFLIRGIDSASLMRVRGYDAGGGDYATLDADYTEPSGLTLPVAQYHYRRNQRAASGIFVPA